MNWIFSSVLVLGLFLTSASNNGISAQNASTETCDAAYPDEDVCIPPPPPDLDCGDIEYDNFTVREPDPHRFDGDGDGIGCES